MQTPSAFLPWEAHEHYEKAKGYDIETGTPPPRPSPRSVGVQYASEKEHRNSYGKKEVAEPKWKHTQVWLCLLVKVKSDALKQTATSVL